MTDTARRPVLSLKTTPKALRPAPANWKCRPCGATFSVADELAETDFVRCPNCNAKLGAAADFRRQPPSGEGLRARPVAPTAAAPAPAPVMKPRRTIANRPRGS